MSPIPTNSSPVEASRSAAINRGQLSLLSKPGDKSSGGAESFNREVERAVARQGGEQAVEARRQEHSGARRSKRHAGFGGERPAAQVSEASEPGDREQAIAELVPIEQRRQPEAARRAAQPRAQERGLVPQSTDDPATSGAERAPKTQVLGSAPGASEVPSGTPESAPELPGISNTQAAAAGSPAAAGAVLHVRPTAGPRASDASQAFVDSAKAKSGAVQTRSVAGTGSTPDPKMLEHAEKVLRQIRMNVRPGLQEITLNLKPVNLGRLSIDMRMQSGALTAVVRAESPETLELLKQQAPELRAVLAQQGIETDQLEFKLAFDGSGFKQTEHQRRPERPKRGPAGAQPHVPSTPTTSPLCWKASPFSDITAT